MKYNYGCFRNGIPYHPLIEESIVLINSIQNSDEKMMHFYESVEVYGLGPVQGIRILIQGTI